MLETGFLAGLIAKLAGLGSAAKVAIAGTTAALTLTVAGGAAGVLPLDGGNAGSVVPPVVTDQAATAVDTTTPAASVDAGAAAGDATRATTATGSASVTADAGTVTPTTAAVTTPAIPATGGPVGLLPDLSGLEEIPTQVMACLAPVFDLVSGLPSVSPAQIRQVGSTIVTCVSGIVANVPLPSGLNACISQIMAFVGDLSSQLPAGNIDLGSFDVSACIPAGLPVPTGLPGWTGFMTGGFPFGR